MPNLTVVVYDRSELEWQLLQRFERRSGPYESAPVYGGYRDVYQMAPQQQQQPAYGPGAYDDPEATELYPIDMF